MNLPWKNHKRSPWLVLDGWLEAVPPGSCREFHLAAGEEWAARMSVRSAREIDAAYREAVKVRS